MRKRTIGRLMGKNNPDSIFTVSDDDVDLVFKMMKGISDEQVRNNEDYEEKFDEAAYTVLCDPLRSMSFLLIEAIKKRVPKRLLK